MKKTILLALIGITFATTAQEYPVLQSTNKVNNSPWYGLGLSNVNLPNSDSNSVQVAGYYGLLFKTKLGELVLHQNGNVGIGITNPLDKLEISGNLKLNGPRDNDELRFESQNGFHRIAFRQLRFYDWDGGGDNLTINNGNVGIGITNPLDKLEISGNLKLNGPRDNDELRFESQNGFHRITFRQLRFYDWDGGGDNLTINNGKVGIGTTSPDMKLTVKGNIHAEEVKIDLNVPAPDYVFKENYDLRTIEELENFIKKYSHLPEIPSAKEFERNGVMQAEMDMNLLKKIEELTLYTIQQEKKINEQANEIKELKNLNTKLVELQSKLEKLESKK